jgi:peptidoglycan/LPS O-acetylase OafA/YrhL
VAIQPVNVEDPTVSRRFSELDAIRGLACLQVLFLHFRDMWLVERTLPPIESRVLHLLRPFYGGHEAVVLFFLLSGLVLSLPYIHKRQQP